jgi:lipase maturation factor 1
VNVNFGATSGFERPVLIYDGDCGFCTRWIQRWRRLTRGQIEAMPLQHPDVTSRFPGIARADLEASVHFIEPGGRVSRGAEAAFRSLSFASRMQWLLRLYLRSRGFARISEWIYEFISRHRRFFSVVLP